jgi:hypothetical protein
MGDHFQVARAVHVELHGTAAVDDHLTADLWCKGTAQGNSNACQTQGLFGEGDEAMFQNYLAPGSRSVDCLDGARWLREAHMQAVVLGASSQLAVE